MKIEIEITEKEILALESLDDEYCYGHWRIMRDLQIERKESEKLIKRLMILGLVQYVKGLFDEDGMTAGSGFSLTSFGLTVRQKARETELKALQDNE